MRFILPSIVIAASPFAHGFSQQTSNRRNLQTIKNGVNTFRHLSAVADGVVQGDDISSSDGNSADGFDLETAMFAAGLAFDSYVEPAQNSSRWERGSKGMNVAFLSNSFTRNLYKGLIEVTILKASGLPDDDDGMEKLISGDGVDAAVLVAAIEGQWKEDIALLKQEYHEGILDLTGAAHIGRSSTAWSNVNENKSKAQKKKTGKAPPYHVPKTWGRDAMAIWPEPEPFFLYVQDPANALLLFTLFDDDVIGDGSAIGSTYTPLSKVLPQVLKSQEEMISKVKNEIIERIRKGELDPMNVDEEIARAVQKDTKAWEGDLKLTSKPRLKSKNGQVALGMAAGALVAGPVGAAIGGTLGNMYEGQLKGRISLRLRYLPIPQVDTARKVYNVYGGMPGINWGELYMKFLEQKTGMTESDEGSARHYSDLEHCFFINHDETGGCCAVYRSLEKKMIIISFRGTCKPVDIATDASIVQETWVLGEDAEAEGVAKVHVGFRKSMNSISRRLKELLLATVAPGDSISDYDMLVTGHSLGGALATIFTADIGEYGIDAGRALPQLDESDAWWKAITNVFTGGPEQVQNRSPPRPKSLRMYNFGSPRVGNKAFAQRFDNLIQEGKIDQAYRIVNNQDVVARAPRSMMTLSVDYDHCGSTVLVREPTVENPEAVLWIEGESDDTDCPVRDYQQKLSNPFGEGMLLGDLVALGKGDPADVEKKSEQILDKLGSVASRFQKRISEVTAADVTSILGFDKTFTERELKMVTSLVKGDGLANHMEDSYYRAMGRAGGFVAVVGEDIVPASGADAMDLLRHAESDEGDVTEELA